MIEKTKKSNNDPLGRALLDYIEGNKREFIKVKSSLGEEDQMWVSQFFRSYLQMPEVERKALALCKGKILDVGAGAGAHSLYLESKNLQVFPIDVSHGAVEVMKRQGLKNSRLLDFFKIENETYDTLLLLMNGLGIVGKKDRLKEFFSQSKLLLNPKGRILLDSSDIIYMFEEEDGSFEIELNKYYGEVVYKMTYKDIKGPAFPWLFMDFHLFQEIADENGFEARLICTQDKYAFCCICELKN